MCCSGEQQENELVLLKRDQFQEENFEPKDKFKIIVIGNSGVGKTSLLNRYMYQKFECPFTTISANRMTKTIDFPNDLHLNLEFWDTAGEERYHSFGPLYYRDCDVVILSFDLTNHRSLVDLNGWQKLITEGRGPDFTNFLVVGTKLDLKNKREVSEKEARVWCQSHILGLDQESLSSLPYVETSAKKDIGFEEMGDHLVKIVFKGTRSRFLNIKSAK